MNINSRSIQLSGSFEIPEDVKAGADLEYEITTTGSIDAFKPSDNHDGTWSVTYYFKPLIGQIQSTGGHLQKMKLKTSHSKKMRAMIVYDWDLNYEQVMNTLLAHGDELKEWYEKTKDL